MHLGVLWLLGAALWAGTAQAAWSYEYADNFETDKAQTDSYAHSPFGTSDMAPLPEPYLYYVDTSSGRGIAFRDYKDQPAQLSYCFPLGPVQGQRVVKGTLQIDVSFPSNATISQYVPGNLTYKTSSDGLAWSASASLAAGRHAIPISSTGGTCYLVLSGTRAVIDNLAVSLSSPEATIHVPGNFATIQAAINFAGHGDVIEVAPGRYSGPGNWDIEFRGKAITVRSTDGPESTVIDCSDPGSATGHRGFYFHGVEGRDSILSGFTIQSGRISGSQVPSSWSSPNPSHPIGGGIYCEFSGPTIANCIVTDCRAEIGGGIGLVGATPLITDCTITDCVAGGQGSAASGGLGGGIGLVEHCDATIVNCTIENNRGFYDSHGGGIYCWESTAVVSGCRIAGNEAPGNLVGGGAYCGGARADVTFQNCVFSRNTALAGGGLFAEWSSSFGSSWERAHVSVVNCTLAQNELSGALAWPYPGGGIESSSAEIAVSNSIVWHNAGSAVLVTGSPLSEPVTYSNVRGGYTGTGNINQDPGFASLGADDYHLVSSYGRYDAQRERWVTDGSNSPCIDAGDPSVSATDEPTPNGNKINMGTYGGTRQASKSAQNFTYHVNAATGRDRYDGLSADRSFKTIQAAIDEAQSGDRILVWPGTYHEDLYFGKAITVQSATDAAVIVGNAYAFSFYYGESSKSVVSNFIIKGCRQAAVLCVSASPALRNLTIVNNTIGVDAQEGADPYIVNCIFWGNSNADLEGCQASYSCLQHNPPDSFAHNINSDPLFADPDNEDFHLKSRYGRYVSQSGTWATDSVTSPCIDKGDDSEYPRAERTPNGNVVNMGAYGDTPYASLSGWPPY